MHLQPACCGAALGIFLLPDCCLVYLETGPAAALITGLKVCSSFTATSLCTFGSASDHSTFLAPFMVAPQRDPEWPMAAHLMDFLRKTIS